jgi:hypothetical protein
MLLAHPGGAEFLCAATGARLSHSALIHVATVAAGDSGREPFLQRGSQRCGKGKPEGP